MKSVRRLSALFGSSLIFAFTPQLSAQVIYDNIGNSDPFSISAGWTIGTPQQQEVAFRFVAGSTSFLDYAEIGLWMPLTGTPLVNVGLLADGGGTPGAVLETASAALFLGPNLRPLTRVEFSNTVAITAGSVYWLAVSPADSTTWSSWEHTGRPFGTVAFDLGAIGFSDPWSTVSRGLEPFARVVGTPSVIPVPEPSTYGLIGSLLLASLVALRRRTK